MSSLSRGSDSQARSRRPLPKRGLACPDPAERDEANLHALAGTRPLPRDIDFTGNSA